MPKADEIRAKIRAAEKERDETEREVAQAIAWHQRVEKDLHERRGELQDARARLANKQERTPGNEQRAAKLAEEVAELEQWIEVHADQLEQRTDDLVKAEAKVDREKGRLHRTKKKIKGWRRKLRNLVKPKIVNLPFNNPSSGMGSIIGTTGHYTAGPRAANDEQAERMYYAVRAQHLGQGWSEIGYHLGAGPEGTIFTLRYLKYAGAHTLGRNTGYVGFNVHGTTGDTWTTPQLRAFRYALKHFGLIDKPVWGHNDWNATACPGSFKAGYTSKGKRR